MKLEQVAEFAFDFCGLEPGAPVLVGVSGGPDSMCLLDVLHRLALPLVVAHFNHNLRPNAAMDAQVARQAAEARGLPFLLGSGDVAGFASQAKRSLEEAARALRYRYLFDQARALHAQAVAVGHNADDQVETVLMHLLRGSGLTGLTGMPFTTVLPAWDPGIPLVRPLLAFSREVILAYCQERGIEPVYDESNQDRAFFRNRLRHELIPLLESYNPRVRQAIWRTAQLLAGDAEVVQAAVRAVWERCRVDEGPGYTALRLDALQALQPGLQRGVLRLAIDRLLPHLRDVDFAAVERAARFVSQPAPGQVDLVQGLIIFREVGRVGDPRLVIARPGELPTGTDWLQLSSVEEQALPVPGSLWLAGGWLLESDWEDLPKGEDAGQTAWLNRGESRWEAWIDPAALPGSLYLRRMRPGDRFQPLGMSAGSVKLSDFWITQKLPRRARAAWPIVTAGEEIVWIPGYRLAHPFRVQPGTRRVLRLRVSRPVDDASGGFY